MGSKFNDFEKHCTRVKVIYRVEMGRISAMRMLK